MSNYKGYSAKTESIAKRSGCNGLGKQNKTALRGVFLEGKIFLTVGGAVVKVITEKNEARKLL